MSIQKLADNLYIAPQLTEADVAEAVKLGIKSVICNRPDGEASDQPSFTQVQQWLIAAGIESVQHQPVIASTINTNNVAEFQQRLAAAPSPTLAYCRTGTRCSLLWGFEQVKNGTPVANVIAAAAQAGVNLNSFAERLQAAAQ